MTIDIKDPTSDDFIDFDYFMRAELEKILSKGFKKILTEIRAKDERERRDAQYAEASLNLDGELGL